MKLSVLAAPILATFLVACTSSPDSQGFNTANQQEGLPEPADPVTASTEQQEDDEQKYPVLPDGDDYRYDSGMTTKFEPGWKGQRQLEVEKIHRLAKLCITSSNTSAACSEIIRLDASLGKAYINLETEEKRRMIKDILAAE